MTDQDVIADKLVDMDRECDLGGGQQDQSHYQFLAGQIIEALAAEGFEIVKVKA